MNNITNTTNRTQVVYKDISPYYKNKSNIGYDSDENEDAILNSLRNLFLISMGQVPGKPWLGNPINVNLFENISPFIERSIEKAFINTITNFEPRVEIEKVIVQNMTNQPNTVDVELRYYNLIEDKNLLKNYRFSINYNSITNLTLREPI